MKKTILFAVAVTTVLHLHAQEVVSASGETYTNASGSIDYTIGEVAIETISDPSNQLTQGMHQPILQINAIDENEGIAFNLFPNPVSSNATLVVSAVTPGMQYEIFDQLGKLVLTNNITSTSTSIELLNVAMGQYSLKLTDADKNIYQTFQIIKSK